MKSIYLTDFAIYFSERRQPGGGGRDTLLKEKELQILM
jgi:hypothetical protein